MYALDQVFAEGGLSPGLSPGGLSPYTTADML